jgi:uncharacterized protein
MSRRALHLWPLLVLLTGLLYGAVSSRASEAQPSESAEKSVAQAPSAHIALLLPSGSDAFSKAAAAVRAGFSEAAEKQSAPGLAVKLYPVGDDPQTVITAYREALAAGARIVVGPLTRNGVTALAGQPDEITVPTLALNVPMGNTPYPPKLYSLSLYVEAEARQIAQVALRDGHRKALTMTADTALDRRMRDAFIAAFENGGGTHVADVPYATDSASLERARKAASEAELVFLALDADRARSVRPQLPGVHAYASSQLNPGLNASAALIDLNDVIFVDMPWMLQPEHAAVIAYQREPPQPRDDLERLRALGIDAYRVTQELLAGNRDFDIDGVTGHLTLGADNQVRRALLIALIAAGKVTILGETPP